MIFEGKRGLRKEIVGKFDCDEMPIGKGKQISKPIYIAGVKERRT